MSVFYQHQPNFFVSFLPTTFAGMANEKKQVILSWRVDSKIAEMLAAVSKDAGEPQIALVREWIKSEFKSRGLKLPKPEKTPK